MSRVIRIAAAQYQPEALSSPAAHAAKITRWVEEAVGQGAELLVFPEYGAMELATALGPVATLEAAITTVTRLVPHLDDVHRGLALRHGVTIVAGSFLERTPEGIYNVAHVFGPGGRMARYAKLMPTPWEREVAGVQGGSELLVLDTGGVRAGLVICYDIEFPLIGRALAEAGAEIILAPSNTETKWGYWRVRTGATARALENQLYTVHCPTVGKAPRLVACPVNVGAAGIFAPSDRGFPPGGVVALGEMNRPQWVHARLDLDLLAEVRASGGVQTFRHWPEQPGAAPLPAATLIDISGASVSPPGSRHVPATTPA